MAAAAARSASPWLANGEEVEDTEIVHAAAPGAAIREVLISDQAQDSPAAASADVAAALRLGLTPGAVISFSHSWGERCFTTAEVAQLNSALQAARSRHVTVINSSGDLGAVANPCPGAVAGTFPGVRGVNLLDADPLVLAAGGTSLQASQSTGAYASESVWNSPPGQSALGFSASSGGGFSQIFPRPAYQDGVAGIGATRGVPDVAADADGGTGMAMALSDGGQSYILAGTGGDRAAAPPWAPGLSSEAFRRLWLLSVRTIGGFAALPAASVETRFGAGGLVLHRLARGVDPRPPAPATAGGPAPAPPASAARPR